jgi:hypothetical protein
MAATQYGTGLKQGATSVTITTFPNSTNYYIEGVDEGDTLSQVVLTQDADGALANRSVQHNLPRVTLRLICKTAATPLSDFPKDTSITCNTNQNWWVESGAITISKDPWKVAVTIVKLGLAVVP